MDMQNRRNAFRDECDKAFRYLRPPGYLPGGLFCAQARIGKSAAKAACGSRGEQGGNLSCSITIRYLRSFPNGESGNI